MNKDLLFTIPKKYHNKESLISIFEDHPEIKFVSLVGVDLAGNDTDEKIPSKLFLKDIDSFLHGTAVQTDGSSVVLPGIATLNNAKVDMIADLDCKWFVDYNYDFIDPLTNRPVGTLRIPCFLIHEDKAVDSRHILKNSIDTFKSNIFSLLKKYPETLNDLNIKFDDIDDLLLTSATELEFWVKTPNDKALIEELSTSEVLQEQYWTRTKGNVRTALEQSLLYMDEYGFEPEMGHKEVGGVKAKLTSSGQFDHIMEQLEIDWKFSDAMQAADNELFIRTLVKETFRRNGLEVTFLAKPISGVAGSGEHTHLSLSLKLKDGRIINLFNPTKNHFLSKIGYGSIMGILKNYEVMNPFISATTDSLKRLKPGFEAPVCIVTSLGQSPEVPSRNRTILAGLIRDPHNPLATRFELRSPNPFTNTYLCIASSYMAMLDGIKYALENNKTEDDLLAELSKKPGEEADYLEKSRAYRSEEDVFEDFTDSQRNEYFGVAPATVFENLSAFDKYPEKVEVLKVNSVFTDKLINSFKMATTKRWTTEITSRIIPSYTKDIRAAKQLHCCDKALDLDVSTWMTINELRHITMKDSYHRRSLFTQIKNAINESNFEKASDLQIKLDKNMSELNDLYSTYKKNLLDI
ncbi:glutamine synthetase [Clostridium perfringens]|uniref:Glutamine synthetase n=1 Tax=Clostridium perfringens E str. JGS1987 TaxID=451755 RepID=B1BSH9_CLOPF|nr:glutamine synthetase [Clostridium perfringens]ALG50164.1 Glutamine synthetase, clostridia type [Clostridium perfringens]EDT15361.1 putative glutamine synthetase [Clostridium perfringens E str. JGS1987]EJT6534861.1 glutamine synthetase [Clostridium perfringens]EJT6559268.1 glutamine synthetase [Clostridium perfringens]ELC8354059.1 glutamine synthetase [Clostridium perfringens]